MNTLLLSIIVFFTPGLIALIFHRPILRWLDGYFYRRLEVEQYNHDNHYANGNFAPVHTELQNIEATVHGTIPDDLSGEYLRNGPNMQHKPTGRMHMFDGEGMIHQIRIAQGKAFYSNTFIRTPKYKYNEKNGRDCFTHVGDLAGGGGLGMAKIVCEILKKKIGMLPNMSRLESGTGSTSLLFHHNKLYALQEVGYPFALSVEASTEGGIVLTGEGEFERFNGKLTAPFSAHVKIDPDTQEIIFFSNSVDSGHIFYAELSKEGMLKTFRPIQKDTPCIGFLHDSFITKNFAICPDMSIRFDVKKMRSEYKSPWFFDADTNLRFGVVRRKPDKNGETTQDVQWFDTGKPGFIWHTINGWEEQREDGGTDILLFAPVFDHYPSNIPIHLPEEPKTNIWMWRLNLETGQITEQRKLVAQFFERPSINDKYLGKKNRFAYLLDKRNPRGILGCGVHKYDLHEERFLESYSYGDDFGGEPLFVEKRDATQEDDGYILELLMNEKEASLIVLDASNLALLAKITLPQRVPFGVHSLWIPKTETPALFRNPS